MPAHVHASGSGGRRCRALLGSSNPPPAPRGGFAPKTLASRAYFPNREQAPCTQFTCPTKLLADFEIVLFLSAKGVWGKKRETRSTSPDSKTERQTPRNLLPCSGETCP